jgi:hypothetical protein
MFARIEARRRVARASADVLESWRRNGRLPKPINDPFGGPLRYRVTGKECVVYSIDFDRKDNGGVVKDEDNPTGDIAWRFPLPERDSATILAPKR